MADRKGLLVVVSGFSGAGKGTLIRELMRRYDNYRLSVSATTRLPRPGETDGRDYFFVTKERFEEMIAKNELIEYTTYVGNYYGTPRAFVEREFAAGHDVLLEIEIEGAKNIKRIYPDAVLIFVTPPDAATLKERLTGRGTETPEQIAARLSRAAVESRWMPDYDYLLINDDLDQSVERLHNLIESQHGRMDQNREFAEKISRELKSGFLKEE